MSLNADQWQEIDEAFELFVNDKDNCLNLHQLLRSMRALGFDLSKKKLMEEFQKRNIDQNQVQYQQFKDFMSDLIASRDATTEVTAAFRCMDKNNSGKINLQKLRSIACELGQVVSEAELKMMIQMFDNDGDGQINLQEFLGIFQEK